MMDLKMSKKQWVLQQGDHFVQFIRVQILNKYSPAPKMHDDFMFNLGCKIPNINLI